MSNRSLVLVVTNQVFETEHVFRKGTKHEHREMRPVRVGGIGVRSKRYPLKGSKAGVSAGVNFGRKPIVFGDAA